MEMQGVTPAHGRRAPVLTSHQISTPKYQNEISSAVGAEFLIFAPRAKITSCTSKLDGHRMEAQWVPIVANAVVSLTGITVAGFVGFLSARQISDLNARRQAGAALRAAFAKEIASVRLALQGDKTVKVEAVLKEAFPRHAAAIEEHRFFVKPRDQAAYEAAWREYHEVGGGVRFFDYYMNGGNFPLFEKRLHAIFEFAER